MATIKELIVKVKADSSQAKKEFKEIGKEVKETGENSQEASKKIETYGKTTKKASDEVKTTSKSMKEYSDKTVTAKKQTGELSNKVKGMIAPVKDVGDAMNVLKGALGAFGISVGISELTQQIQALVDASKEAKNIMKGAASSVVYQYGDLTSTRQATANRLATMGNGSIGYSGDVKDVYQAVGLVGALNPNASEEQIEKLTRAYLNFNEMGLGSLDSNIRDSAQLFHDYNIALDDQVNALEYLRAASTNAGIPFEDMLSTMKESVPYAQAAGKGFEEVASMVAGSMGEFKSTEQITEMFSTYEDVSEEAFETMGEKDAEAYLESYTSTFTNLINTGKYAALIKDSTTQLAGLRTPEEQQKAFDTSGTVRNEVTGQNKIGTFGEESGQIMQGFINNGLDETSAWWATRGADALRLINNMSMEEISDLFDFKPIIEGAESVNTDGLIPMNDSISLMNEQMGYNLEQSTAINDYTNNTLIPTVQNEKTNVDNLAQSYLNLASAKERARDA